MIRRSMNAPIGGLPFLQWHAAASEKWPAPPKRLEQSRPSERPQSPGTIPLVETLFLEEEGREVGRARAGIEPAFDQFGRHVVQIVLDRTVVARRIGDADGEEFLGQKVGEFIHQ